MLKKLITISITAIASLQAATTYDKSLSDGNDALNYWSDTTDSNLNNHTLVGATEVFTIGSRRNLPNIPTPMKVSTNKLCSNDRKGLVSCSKSDSLEPRYTDDGLNTSFGYRKGEPNLRTWYKATTPKSVNGVVDDPCPSLSNVGSVINWWADFGNLRCERTITTYTPKVDSTIYTNKVNSDIYTAKVNSTKTVSFTALYTFTEKYEQPDCSYIGSGINNSKPHQLVETNGVFCSTPVGYGDDNHRLWWDNSFPRTTYAEIIQHCTGYEKYGFQEITRYYLGVTANVNPYYKCYQNATTQVCPDASWSDNITNCKQTIQICPDASWTTATATTCSKVIQVCPDASWTDNGANCKKNVPEYKLFSTF